MTITLLPDREYVIRLPRLPLDQTIRLMDLLAGEIDRQHYRQPHKPLSVYTPPGVEIIERTPTIEGEEQADDTR